MEINLIQKMFDERVGQKDAHKLDEYEWIVGLIEEIVQNAEADLGDNIIELQRNNKDLTDLVFSLEQQLEERNISISAIEDNYCTCKIPMTDSTDTFTRCNICHCKVKRF